MGDSAVLSRCSLLRNLPTKPTGVLEHCRLGETALGSPFFGPFPSDRIPKATNEINVQKFPSCINACSLYQRIPVNYTSKIRDLFEGNTYK
jgi:hypothetical protein